MRKRKREEETEEKNKKGKQQGGREGEVYLVTWIVVKAHLAFGGKGKRTRE